MDINVGTAGYGAIGRTHLMAQQAVKVLWPEEVQANPYCLCTRNEKDFHHRLFQNITQDFEAMAADPQVELVDICTPNFLHFDQAMKALDAGKSVYLEKPLSDRLDKAKLLADKARESGLPNQCALNNRFVPAVNSLKDMILEGVIGEIVHFKLNYYHWSYINPDRPTSWRQQLDKAGGGAVMDLGVHYIDLIRYLLGEIKSLRAEMRTINRERFTDETRTDKITNDTDEYMTAMVTLVNGAVGHFEASRISPLDGDASMIAVFGSKGSLVLKEDMRTVVFYNGITNTVAAEKSRPPGVYERSLLAFSPHTKQNLGFFMNSHTAAMKNMLHLHRGLPVFLGAPDFQDAYEAQRIVSACLKSAKERKEIYL